MDNIDFRILNTLYANKYVGNVEYVVYLLQKAFFITLK